MNKKNKTKPEVFELVRNVVKECPPSFIAKNITDRTKLNHQRVLYYLKALVEMGELKYSESTKIYMKIREDSE